MVAETVSYMHTAITENKRILVECAQSTILDIDFGKCYSYFLEREQRNLVKSCSLLFIRL